MPFPSQKNGEIVLFWEIRGVDDDRTAQGKGTTSVVPKKSPTGYGFSRWGLLGEPRYSGIFPCFFNGFLSRLFSSMANA